MKVESVVISNIAGIEELRLNPHPRLNIICGSNGVGKTTVLESIAHLFAAGYTNILKKRAGTSGGYVEGSISNVNTLREVRLEVMEFSPRGNQHVGGQHDLAVKVLAFKTNRLWPYHSLEAVVRDRDYRNHASYEEAKTGVQLGDIKSWIVNRFLYSALPNALQPQQMLNFQHAKDCFSILSPEVHFSHVDAATNEIMLDTPAGMIFYEYLSSGYRSTLSLLLGIIKELELRNAEPRIVAADFDGIIFVDEIELHLHPEWQAKVVDRLLTAFPKAQFFVSTHSPHVLQSADPAHVIALAIRDGRVVKRELPQNEHGFAGWTIEEILTDIMGMGDLRAPAYFDAIKLFDLAVDRDDVEKARLAFADLDKMLHPKSVARKMLSFQLNAMSGEH